jgi:hypothetical protein
MANKVVISTNIAQTLTEAVEEVKHDKLFLLMDGIRKWRGHSPLADGESRRWNGD